MKSALFNRFQLTFGVTPEFVARAPGRIEFLGNHTDYNGGTVLGVAIDRAVWVGLTRRSDGRRRFASDQRVGLVDLAAGAMERTTGDACWVNYPLGVLAAFPNFGLAAPAGFDFLAMTDLPVGAGLSSSAALELASAWVFAVAGGASPERETLVKVARWAENEFVGVPCGLLDQGVVGLGARDQLVWIDCRGPHFAMIPLPAGAHFWVFNTPTRHALVDGLYAERHRECRLAARALGVAQLVDANLAGADWEQVAGLSSVAAKRARHVVEEIARVGAAVAALRQGDLAVVGRLLTASHRSSQRWFENSTVELDLLVDTLENHPRVWGARLTGGGFGGAVMAMTMATFDEDDARRVGEVCAVQWGTAPESMHLRTGDGAGLI